jgi:hypothetical protein
LLGEALRAVGAFIKGMLFRREKYSAYGRDEENAIAGQPERFASAWRKRGLDTRQLDGGVRKELERAWRRSV